MKEATPVIPQEGSPHLPHKDVIGIAEYEFYPGTPSTPQEFEAEAGRMNHGRKRLGYQDLH